MVPWQKRPIEVANLLNPAFCALLLSDAATGYSELGEALPYPLIYLILPFVLHQPTRNALPSRITILFPNWVQQNPSAQINLIDRIQRLQPYTREALLFALQRGALQITQEGCVEHTLGRVKDFFPERSEPNECRKAARFLGRWLAKQNDTSFVLAFLGLRP